MSRLETSTTKSDRRTLDVFASIRFFGDKLEPDRITEILCAEPTLAYRKGEVYKRTRGHEIRGRTGLWLISSKRQVKSPDLNDHLEYLLNVVIPILDVSRLTRLQDLMRDGGIEADAGCFWYGEHGATPPFIRSDLRERLALLPAQIETDFDTD